MYGSGSRYFVIFYHECLKITEVLFKLYPQGFVCEIINDTKAK